MCCPPQRMEPFNPCGNQRALETPVSYLHSHTYIGLLRGKRKNALWNLKLTLALLLGTLMLYRTMLKLYYLELRLARRMAYIGPILRGVQITQ